MMKFKSTILIFVCGCMMISAFAESFFDGFYAGANAGEVATQTTINAFNANNRLVDIPSILPPDVIINNQANNIFSTLAQKQAIGGAFHLGYGHSITGIPVYVALEAFGSYTNRKPVVASDYSVNFSVFPSNIISSFTGIASTTVKLNSFEYGLDFKPALLLTPYTLFYARVGLALNQAQLTSQGTVQATVPSTSTAPPLANTVTATNQKNVTGLRLGFGLERYITERLTVSLDYIYTNYGNVEAAGGAQSSINVVNFGTVTATSANQSNAVNVRSQAFLLGMNYYFSGNGVTDFVGAMVDHETAAHQVNGFYGGVRAGYEGTLANTTVTTSALVPALAGNAPMVMSQANYLWKNSATGAVFLGFGGLLADSSFYFGGEVFADTAAHNMISSNSIVSNNTLTEAFETLIVNSNLATNTTINLSSAEFGFDLRPGLMISTNTLAYLRLGIAMNKAKITSSSTLNVYDSQVIPSIPFAASGSATSLLNTTQNKNLPGWRAGVGLEQYLGHCFSFNVDYIFTYYGGVTVDSAANSHGFIAPPTTGPFVPTTVVNGLTNQVKTNLYAQALTVGVTWHFANPWR